MEKIKLLFLSAVKFLNETPKGRTIKRAAKTFAYTFAATYIATRTAPFEAEYLFIFETSLLSAFGFGLDKGLREFTKK